MPDVISVLDGHHQFERLVKTSPPTDPAHRFAMTEIVFGDKDPLAGYKRRQTNTGPVVFRNLWDYATLHHLDKVLAILLVQKVHLENCMFPLSVEPFEMNANGQLMAIRDSKCEIFFSVQNQGLYFEF